MKKTALVIIAVLIVLLSFCGCGKKNEPREVITEKYSGTPADFFEDVSAVQGFMCLYSVNGGEETCIQGENAGKIYKLIKEQMKSVEEIPETERPDEGIKLVFKNETEKTDPGSDGEVKDKNVKYYGSVTVYSDDTLSFSGSPDATVQLCYKVPEGTYNSVAENLKLN